MNLVLRLDIKLQPPKDTMRTTPESSAPLRVATIDQTTPGGDGIRLTFAYRSLTGGSPVMEYRPGSTGPRSSDHGTVSGTRRFSRYRIPRAARRIRSRGVHRTAPPSLPLAVARA